jgi:hypothetical protein
MRSGGGSRQQIQEKKLQLEAAMKELEEIKHAKLLKYQDLRRKVIFRLK